MGLRTWFNRIWWSEESVPVRASEEDGRFVADVPDTTKDEAGTTKNVSDSVSSTVELGSVTVTPNGKEKKGKPAHAAPKKDTTLKK
jgi:hypothetical protein